jgi:hypothetical protein
VLGIFSLPGRDWKRRRDLGDLSKVNFIIIFKNSCGRNIAYHIFKVLVAMS